MKKYFTIDELDNMQEIARIAASEKFKADFFEKNTAALNIDNVGQGKLLADQQRKVANLMERVYQEYMSAELQKRGYTTDQKVTMNLKTGEVKVLPKE